MRLIDADILYRKLGWSARDCELAEIIEKIPTVDAVEVVRCKDCKYSSPNGKYGCNLITDDGSREMGLLGDDYCSYGKRREEE